MRAPRARKTRRVERFSPARALRSKSRSKTNHRLWLLCRLAARVTAFPELLQHLPARSRQRRAL
jgi:hypothetical protein